MAPTIHFALLVLVALSAIGLAFAFRKRRRKDDLRAWLGGLGVSAGIAFAAYILSAHLCDRGNPQQQWFIPAISTILVWRLVDSLLVRAAFSTIAATLAIALSMHYAEFVHRDGWTGNPQMQLLDQTVAVELEWHTLITGMYRYRSK